MRLTSIFGLAATLATATAAAQVQAQALETVGRPVNGLMGFQPAATELARDIHNLDYMLLIIIGVISVFVTGLLIFVMLRFNGRANKKPASFTHNSPLEIAWTVIPILILVFIGAFSLPVLFKQQEIPVADITIKATGNQWYWSYEYVQDGTAPVEGEEPLTFDSLMLDGSTKVASLGDDQPIGTPQILDDIAISKLEALGYSREDWLLATDTAVIIPAGKIVVVQTTGSDVIHSWTIPAFGVKQDAVPGRIGQLWFKADKEGVYFGQCSELCGKSHAYMPITVKVVSQPVYDQWIAAAKAAGGWVPLPNEVASVDAPMGAVRMAASN
ncbi:MAG: cytochrome c oxidase subunit II [Cereibacter sphaeroides]|uniref:Cytochrome c oxidase subunit 2 n=1 Tax=Cereibacter sphaeroides TaxID=1063 RepID=A0A2W5SD39_CERSP|nr:MAG: cytochrome c oxidase subunit II [Cereibacter sphaeroides]